MLTASRVHLQLRASDVSKHEMVHDGNISSSQHIVANIMPIAKHLCCDQDLERIA